MADVQALLEQARALGRAIAAHPRIKTFLEARDVVSKDGDAQRLLADYQRQAERLHQLEAEQKPISVDDKHNLAEVERKMASNDGLKKLMRAQADYIDLMHQVNRAMEEPLAGPEPTGSA